jgi:hypothetical protein
MLLRLCLLLSSGFAVSCVLGAANAQFDGSVLARDPVGQVQLAQGYYPPPSSPPAYNPPAYNPPVVSPPPVQPAPPPTINSPTWETPSYYPTTNYPTTYYR